MKEQISTLGVDNTPTALATANANFLISTVAESKKTRDPFLGILSKARNVYKKQIDRNAQTKKSAIGHVLKLADKDRNMDDVVFRANFYDIVFSRLLDSKRFNSDCVRSDLNPFNVAQHVVFDGNRKLDEVLIFGLDKVYGNELCKMREPIFSELELCEAKGLPLKEGHQLTVKNSEGSASTNLDKEIS